MRSERVFRWITDRLILGPTRHPMPAAGKSRRALMLPMIGPLEIWTNRVGPDARPETDLFILKFPGTASRAEDPTDALILRDPPPLCEIMRQRHATRVLGRVAARLADHIPEELDVITNAANSDTPAVMLLSQQDRVVPFDLQCRVVKAYCGPSKYLVLTEADHGEAPSASELGELKNLTGWLWDAVSERRVG